MGSTEDPLLETLKKAGVALKQTGLPFALGGGYAVYARGGNPSTHDVDFFLRGSDGPQALAALDKAGLRTEEPADEDWLAKAYDGDVLVDLVFRTGGRPVDGALLGRAEELDVDSVYLPVAEATDLFVGKLLTFTAHYCDFSDALAAIRSLREQLDWARLRRETASSPYARAFLVLTDELGLSLPVDDLSADVRARG